MKLVDGCERGPRHWPVFPVGAPASGGVPVGGDAAFGSNANPSGTRSCGGAAVRPASMLRQPHRLWEWRIATRRRTRHNLQVKMVDAVHYNVVATGQRGVIFGRMVPYDWPDPQVETVGRGIVRNNHPLRRATRESPQSDLIQVSAGTRCDNHCTDRIDQCRLCGQWRKRPLPDEQENNAEKSVHGILSPSREWEPM